MSSTVARMEAISCFTCSLGDVSSKHIIVKALSIGSKCPTKMLGRVSSLSSPPVSEFLANCWRDSLSAWHLSAVSFLLLSHCGQLVINEFLFRGNVLIVILSCSCFIFFCLAFFLFHFIPVVCSVVVCVTPHSKCSIWIS